MITSILYLCALLVMGVLGYLTLTAVYRGVAFLYRSEYLVYSFLTGFIVVPTLLFFGSIVGVPLNAWWVLGVLGLASLALLGVAMYRGNIRPPFASFTPMDSFLRLPIWARILVVLAIVWIVCKLCIGGLHIFSIPTYTDDTFGNWNGRGKNWFYAESLILDKNDPLFLWGGYRQYPVTISMNKTYLSIMTGGWDEWVVNSVAWLVYIAVCLAVFFALYRESAGSVAFGVLGTYVMTSLPLLHLHGVNPYSDLFQGVYFFVAVYFVYLFLQKRIDYVLPLLFSGFLIYTKSEGLVIFLTTVLVCLWGYVAIAAYRGDKSLVRPSSYITLGSLAIGLPFIVFKMVYGLGFGNGDASVSSTALWFHPEIFRPFFDALFFEGNYNIFFLLLSGTFVYQAIRLGRTKRWEEVFFSVAFLAGFFLIGFIYLTTFTYQYVLDQTGVNRSMVQLLVVGSVALVYPLIRIARDIKN